VHIWVDLNAGISKTLTLHTRCTAVVWNGRWRTWVWHWQRRRLHAIVNAVVVAFPLAVANCDVIVAFYHRLPFAWNAFSVAIANCQVVVAFDNRLWRAGAAIVLTVADGDVIVAAWLRLGANWLHFVTLVFADRLTPQVFTQIVAAVII
jgi:hypothetical protein